MDALFEFLAGVLHFPVDKVRYVTLFFLSIPLAYVFRVVLHYKYTSCTTRHLFSMLFGILFCWLCFKWQTLILIGFILFGYCLLLMLPPSSVHIYSLIYALTGVGIGHIYRMYTDYGSYTLDFTGPLMMIVQRVSYVAFAYHDGVHRKKEELSEDQDKHKIISLPTLLEYLSYNVSFLTILTGPTLTFNEYDNFISGKNFSSTIEDPSSLIPTVKTLLGSLVFVVIYALSSSRLSRDLILSPDISFIERLINITIFCFVSRCMYYFTFLIVESSCNAAGLGYSGLDDKGKEKWDLARNIDILSFELGTNARQVISSWNIRTTIWIRRVIYERILWNQVIIANLASALWHGFYPGYYLSFIIVGVATIAARKLRRLLWHNFQEPPVVKTLYNIITTLCTSVIRDLAQLFFWFSYFSDTIIILKCYYIPIIFFLCSFAIILFLPDKKSQKIQ